VTLVAVDDGKEVPGKLQAMLDHVEYILHPTFFNPRRGKKKKNTMEFGYETLLTCSFNFFYASC
jgi:hypothetical protein